MMSKPTAIILAAGQGTRLMPLTNEVPKCMVEISGKPILNWQLDTMTAAGIDNIIVVTGYKEEKIDDPRITKVYNEKYASTNMIYSLFCAEEYLKKEVLICYGDIIYSPEVLYTVLDDDRDIVITSDEEWYPYWQARCDNVLVDAETFKKGVDGKVASLGKKAQSIDDIEGQFIGLIKLTDKGTKRVKEVYHVCSSDKSSRENAWGSGRDIQNAYMTDLMNYFASQGELYYSPIQRGWFEVDNQVDLNIADKGVKNLFNNKYI